ncbi:uncharacterized protein EV154DRAFT_523556 [Mucor mucedo]|uniref:uncharacterized protein n=1 Tax=Mucor mucedo TaxID=29922 RepID=UPI00221E742F|nr:uncharacterized protein EV154DRAFT_523556 [Mucor mucedo]KAI7881213.1 hypothetical protein EV154DRAFT_523556 [Mucor mucedo]
MNEFDDSEFYEHLERLKQKTGRHSLDEDVVMTETLDVNQVAEDTASDGTQVIQAKDDRDEKVPDYLVALRNGIYNGPEVIEISSDSDLSDDDDVQFLYELPPARERRDQTEIQPNEEQSKQEYIQAFMKKVQSSSAFNRCKDCRAEMIGTKNEFQLAQYGGKEGFCLGCTKLRNLIRSHEERQDFLSWLVTGKIPKNDPPPRITYEAMVYRLKSRRKMMGNKVIRNNCDGQSLATTGELTEMCFKSQFKCAISGSQIAFHTQNKLRYPYWAFSIDHRLPLNHNKYQPEAWGIDNLQAMSAVMNTIKSDLSDQEIFRWYKAYYNAHCIEL